MTDTQTVEVQRVVRRLLDELHAQLTEETVKTLREDCRGEPLGSRLTINGGTLSTYGTATVGEIKYTLGDRALHYAEQLTNPATHRWDVALVANDRGGVRLQLTLFDRAAPMLELDEREDLWERFRVALAPGMNCLARGWEWVWQNVCAAEVEYDYVR